MNFTWQARLFNSHVMQVNGELGQEMAQHADKFLNGVVSNVETSYSRFEQVLKKTLGMPLTRKRQPARRAKTAALTGVARGGVSKAPAKPAAAAAPKPAQKKRKGVLW